VRALRRLPLHRSRVLLGSTPRVRSALGNGLYDRDPRVIQGRHTRDTQLSTARCNELRLFSKHCSCSDSDIKPVPGVVGRRTRSPLKSSQAHLQAVPSTLAQPPPFPSLVKPAAQRQRQQQQFDGLSLCACGCFVSHKWEGLTARGGHEAEARIFLCQPLFAPLPGRRWHGELPTVQHAEQHTHDEGGLASQAKSCATLTDAADGLGAGSLE
jgi:hypothetical protein